MRDRNAPHRALRIAKRFRFAARQLRGHGHECVERCVLSGDAIEIGVDELQRRDLASSQAFGGLGDRQAGEVRGLRTQDARGHQGRREQCGQSLPPIHTMAIVKVPDPVTRIMVAIFAMSTIPYGAWPSPLSAARVTAGALRFDQIQLDGTDVYWIEGRASEGGRNVIVKRLLDGIDRRHHAAGLQRPLACSRVWRRRLHRAQRHDLFQ